MSHITREPISIQTNENYRLFKNGIDITDKISNPIIKFFAYNHLPEHLQKISKPVGELAEEMEQVLPNSAEKSAGLRKLLEAKDCFVRANLT